MATPYTSARNGEWDASVTDTWGQGVGVYPNTAADVVTIAAGHTVTYNKSSTVELGLLTVNGTLYASRAMSTKLTLGYIDIQINNGGIVDFGQTGDIIPNAYTAEIVFNTTVDNVKGIKTAVGGKFYSKGDPVYYGSNNLATLQANWTSGSVFYTTENVSTWKNGQTIYIHKNALYSSYLTDTFLATLNGAPTWDGAKSTVTINEAFPGGTFYLGGYVVNASRNVMISKLGAVTTIGNVNTLRPVITDSNTVAANVVIQDTLITGFHNITSSPGIDMTNSVVRNGDRLAIAKLTGNNLTGVSMNTGVTYSGQSLNLTNVKLFANFIAVRDLQSSSYMQGLFYGNGTAVNNMSSGVIEGDFFSNSNVIASAYKTSKINGNIYYNTYAFSLYGNLVVKGKLGYDANDNLKANGYDVNSFNTQYIKLLGVKYNSAPTIRLRGTSYFYGYVACGDHNALNAHYKYGQYTDIIKNTGTKRTGGASSSIELVPQSALSSYVYDIILGDWIEADVPASAQTRIFYFKGEAWSTFPTAAQLYVEAEYLNHATLFTTTTAVSTAVLTDNTTWTAFPVTFTPLQVGTVRYKVYLKVYAASCKVYMDNALYKGAVMAEAKWSEGESYLLINQSAWTAGGGAFRGILSGGKM